jgi:hypothetical protein
VPRRIHPSPVALRIESSNGRGRLYFVHSPPYAPVSAAAGTSKRERHNLQSPGRCSSSSRNQPHRNQWGAGPHVGGLPQLRGPRGWRGSGWSSPPRSWLHGEELPALLTLVSFPKRLDSTGLKDEGFNLGEDDAVTRRFLQASLPQARPPSSTVTNFSPAHAAGP